MDSDLKLAARLVPPPVAGVSAELLYRLDIEEYLDQLDRVEPIDTQSRIRLTQFLRAVERASLLYADTPPRRHRGDRDPKPGLDHGGESTQREREIMVNFGRRRSRLATGAREFALGNILVVDDQISRPQLESALLGQTWTGRRLGDELIAAGHASKRQIDEGLTLQRNLIAWALALAMSLGPLATSGSMARAAQTTAFMPVSVTVIANTRMQMLHQAERITISAADIARGHIELPAAAHFLVKTNSPSGYHIDFHALADFFASVEVSGLGQPAHLGPEGGRIVRRGPVPTSISHELGFRFTLRAGTVPGTYPWPLSLSVHTR